MKLVELKCKNCGAQLKVEEGTSQVKCEFCGSTFSVDDAYNEGYKYPHDYPGHVVEQQYLPDKIKNVSLFEMSDVAYEGKLKKYEGVIITDLPGIYSNQHQFFSF